MSYRFENLFSLYDAAAIWGRADATLRQAIHRGKFIVDEDVKLFGKQWVITKEAMIREYGNPKNPYRVFASTLNSPEDLGTFRDSGDPLDMKNQVVTPLAWADNNSIYRACELLNQAFPEHPVLHAKHTYFFGIDDYGKYYRLDAKEIKDSINNT